MLFVQNLLAMERREPVKENVAPRAPLDTRWLAGAVALTALALVTAAHLDATLPAPLTRHDAPPNSFVAEIAHEHLVNLTSIGPRVAGSYENEVVAVSVLVEAVRGVAAAAAPHHRVELDVHVASGGFALSFLDGMSNVYRDVQSVVARLTSEPPRALVRARSALLLNCHFDTVPDSPGASDDGAGCAVLLEVMRALAASPRPLRHDVVFLFNGAEENIMQASHGFITQHKWARSIRAFINLEACGAGGREVLFQAGPHDPWLVEAYAAAVPHPFASSLAQELFESGLIPADTDFRIFRDFGQLSGLDLAWNANGYVYHTRLDTAGRVGLGALQRTGDNVLSLVAALVAGEALDSERDAAQRQPVFFDVLGLLVMAARAPAAATLAVATLALVVLKIHLTACDARRHLFVSRGAWWSVVCAAGGCGAVSAAAGAAASVAVALSLHTLDARLAFYSRPALLAPLYALPALAGAWAAARRSWRARRAATVARGWWGARAWHDAAAACWALALAGCTLRGLRSGFLPLMWAALPAAADVAASVLRVAPATRALVWAAGAALPVLQTCYLALGSLHTFVPLMGRAGDPPLPPDMSMALLVAALTLVASGWLLPLVIVSRRLRVPVRGAAAASALAVALVLVTPLGAPYSEERPQRLMVFHTRRTLHAPLEAGDAPRHETFYWIPQLDANTPRSLLAHSPELRAARPVGDDECARWVYCGAPYYLPVLSLVGASHRAAAASEPLVRLRGGVTASPLNGTARALHVRAEGAAHVVVIVSPAAGARLAWSDAVAAPREGPRWRGRRTYFFMLHAARPPHAWRLALHVSHGAVHVSLAAHALFGADALHDDQRRLLAALPPWVAATGWGVDLHLYEV